MEPFTPWTLFVDVGIVAILLLVGKLVRVKVRIAQRLFVPPSLVAGFLGLGLGPEGLGLLPFSNYLSVYAGILIALVFSCLPFSSAGGEKRRGSHIGRMWAYSQTGMLLQWAFGGLVGMCLLCKVWPMDVSFGLAMPGGFCGGHGTAAALGSAFERMGNGDMLSLAMTAATVGILGSVFIGLALVKWGTRKGHTAFLSDFSRLPDELRSGLLPKGKRESMGESTCSSISIDSLAFNLAVILVIALGGYILSRLVSQVMPRLEMPVFSCAFVCGILLKFCLGKARVTEYLSREVIGHLSGTFTDFLVAFGISAIKISVVIAYIVPLTLLLLGGLLFTLLFVLLVGRRLMREYWFEKALFTWGWFTGTMAMGIALLRVADPSMRSRCLDDYALAYLFIAPVEISLVTFAPVAFVNGYGLHFLLAALVLGVLIMGYAAWRGWFGKPIVMETNETYIES
ncbi:MAG: sodium:glutamate symporter [Prevotellaceae bacterium]|nr:sodium:glutamate symporter [Prevotellaceae bacterium]